MQKLQQGLMTGGLENIAIEPDDIRFLTERITDDLDGHGVMDPQLKQLILHPVIWAYVVHYSEDARISEAYERWRQREAYVEDFMRSVNGAVEVPMSRDDTVSISTTEYVRLGLHKSTEI